MLARGESWLFFLQAEDGIRDRTVTGVQTCALPISSGGGSSAQTAAARPRSSVCSSASRRPQPAGSRPVPRSARSEERRVGKECRRRWWGKDDKKKMPVYGNVIAADTLYEHLRRLLL